MSDNHLILAKRFWVDDIPGSSVPGSRLSNLLTTIAQGKPLSALGVRFLIENELKSLTQFISGDIQENQFRQLAPIEQSARIAATAVLPLCYSVTLSNRGRLSRKRLMLAMQP